MADHTQACGNNGNLEKRIASDKQRFLEAYEQCQCVKTSAKAINRGQTTVYRWRKNDPEFAKKWEDTWNTTIQVLEKSAMDRAVNGWLQPVFQGGKEVGAVRKFSDALTIFMLKANMPKYQFEHTVDVENADQIAEQIRKFVANINLDGAPPPNAANE